MNDNNEASSFKLTTEQNGISVVQNANDFWGWVNVLTMRAMGGWSLAPSGHQP